MTKVAEKLVLSFDVDTQAYKPAGHNLLPEVAVELTDKLQTEGKQSLIIDQDSRHHGARNFKDCRLCKTAAENATSKHSQISEREQKPAPASEQSESD